MLKHPRTSNCALQIMLKFYLHILITHLDRSSRFLGNLHDKYTSKSLVCLYSLLQQRSYAYLPHIHLCLKLKKYMTQH